MRKKFSLDIANKQNKMKIICASLMSALLLLFFLSPSGVPEAMASGNPDVDFNGDGYGDLAVGVPNESINGKANAGSVNVVYGSASGISATATPDQRFFQDLAGIEGVSKLDDKLGTDVATADFNGDGYSDLAAGAPGDDYGLPATGSVNVIYGSSGGLSATGPLPDQIWTGSSAGLNDIVLADCSPPAIPDLPIQGFGKALAAGDFNGDGYDDLAIVANDDICFTGQGSVGTFWIRGSLHIIYGSASGLAITPSLDNQHTIGHQITFYSTLETGDFNNDGRDDLAAGDPGDFCCSGAAGSQGGRVSIFHGGAGGFAEDASGRMTTSQNLKQGIANIEGVSASGEAFGSAFASGDFNGDAYGDLAIGDPNEGFAGGAVNVIYGSASGLSATIVLSDQLFTQDSPNVEGTSETWDRFGTALAAGDFNGDGKDDLAVGSPDEDVGPIVDAGSSNVIYGSAPAGLSPTAVLPDRVLDQNSANVEGTSEATDAYSSSGTGSGGFAAAITAGDYNNDGRDDLAIGVPGEDVGVVVDAGSSNVIYGSASGISATAVLLDRVLDQNSIDVEDSCETGDRFGHALA